MSKAPFTVLVLGAYGVFGEKFCRLLAADLPAFRTWTNGRALRLIIAGRNIEKARAFAAQLQADYDTADIIAAGVNAMATDLETRIGRFETDLLVNMVGPYQLADYRIANAAISAGADYVDLADSSKFVDGFTTLDAAARDAGVCALTGASSVPALTAAVVDQLTHGCEKISRIEAFICPGNKAPRGIAVVTAILSYLGRPIPVWRDGKAATNHVLQKLHRRQVTAPGLVGLGRRWVAACDAPDTILFPRRYAGVSDIAFYAGLELSVMHLVDGV